MDPEDSGDNVYLKLTQSSQDMRDGMKNEVLSEKIGPQNYQKDTRDEAIGYQRINNQIYVYDIQNCDGCKDWIKMSADAQLVSKMHEMFHKIPQLIRSSQAQKSETKFQLENSSSVKSGRQPTTAANIIASVDKRQPEQTTGHTHPQTNLRRTHPQTNLSLIHHTIKIPKPTRSRSSAGNVLTPISLQSATLQSNTMLYAKRQANDLLSCKMANHQRNYQESRERNVEDNAVKPTSLPDTRNVNYAMHEQLKQFKSKPSTNHLHSTEHADNSQQETNLRNTATTSRPPLYPTIELAYLKKETLCNNYGQLVLGETSSDNSLPKEMIHGKEKKSETQESCSTSGIRILGTTEILPGRGDEDDSMMVDDGGRQSTTAANKIPSVDKRRPKQTTGHTHPQINLSRIHRTSKIPKPIRPQSSAGNVLTAPISLQSSTMLYAKSQVGPPLGDVGPKTGQIRKNPYLPQLK